MFVQAFGNHERLLLSPTQQRQKQKDTLQSGGRLAWPLLFPILPQKWNHFNRVQCQASAAQPLSEDIDSRDSHPLQPLQHLEEQLLASPKLFARINGPSRMLDNTHTHAVGQLLEPHKVECYQIYKHVPACQAILESESTDAHPTHTTIVTALIRIGDALDGHVGIVHGGIIALLVDDLFGFAFDALGIPFAVTANLNIDYCAPLPSNTNVVVHIQLVKQENRKLFFEASVLSVPKELSDLDNHSPSSLSDDVICYSKSTCLYIIPRNVWEEMQSSSRKGINE